MISNLQMITIYVREMRRAVEFYTEKLGFVKLAEYNDGKDNYLTWVIPQPASKDDLATQIALQELADKDDPRIGSISGLVFTTQTAEEIETTYHELKSRGVHFTLDLVRHDYAKAPATRRPVSSIPMETSFCYIRNSPSRPCGTSSPNTTGKTGLRIEGLIVVFGEERGGAWRQT